MQPFLCIMKSSHFSLWFFCYQQFNIVKGASHREFIRERNLNLWLRLPYQPFPFSILRKDFCWQQKTIKFLRSRHYSIQKIEKKDFLHCSPSKSIRSYRERKIWIYDEHETDDNVHLIIPQDDWSALIFCSLSSHENI